MIVLQQLLMIGLCILIPSMVWLVTILHLPIYPIPPWLIQRAEHIPSVRQPFIYYSHLCMFITILLQVLSLWKINLQIKIYHQQEVEPHPHLSLSPLLLILHFPSPTYHSGLLVQSVHSFSLAEIHEHIFILLQLTCMAHIWI